MIIASSSSVYGKQKKNFKTDLRTDTPIQMYVSKKATELISYSYIFNIKFQ